ncbi:MAG: glycosyltransferase [Gemmatimonadetes bacterium]|nr:glycosyltransferase [Gemmatimonadota bacterium]
MTGTPQRVRVLHVALDLHAGGLERLVADLIRRGDHGRFEYHLLVLRFLGRFGEGLHPYATLHVAPPMGRLSMLHPAALRRQIEAIAPDVIHTHSGVWYKVARAIHGLGRPPLVHTDHGRERPDPGRTGWSTGLPATGPRPWSRSRTSWRSSSGAPWWRARSGCARS